MPRKSSKIDYGVASGHNVHRVSNSGSSNDSQSLANMLDSFPSAQIPPLGKEWIPSITPLQYANMTAQAAKVKSVLSGDTVVLCSVSNSSLERILSLAFVVSPHLRKEGDEQWAFEARDYLRKSLVGKLVQFQVLYEIPNTKRQYGTIWTTEGRKFPEEAVKEGWLKLREDAGRKEDTEEAQRQLSELRLLEAKARSEDIGVWATKGGHIEVEHDLGDAQTFLDTYKGKTFDGLVERVLSGDRMLLRLFVSPQRHVQVMTLVGGIRAPTTERVNPSNGQTQPAEEYGNEARLFVEERMLQRNVRVDVLGLSPQNQLIATVKHPRGSIAKFLLEEGLAHCSDFHSTLLGTEMAPLREAEKNAQAAKKGLHKGHVAKQNTAAGNVDGIVTRVFSADVIYVRSKAGEEKRINISSIRGPRQNDATEAPWRDGAKEFLRKRIIGKHVHLSIDGSRPATTTEGGQSYDAKDVATVTFQDKNIGLQLVQEGWASVVRHKRDDPDRASNYDELLAAQEVAKEAKKGMWSGKPKAIRPYVDASESPQKARLQLAMLQRQKKIPAIVDFVKAGSRFTILIPKESIKMNFVLGGIRAPKSARGPGDKAEPYGQEAHDLASRRLNQRDVQVDVHNIDKVGGFIGEIYTGGESFAKILVEEGLATVHEYSAEQSGNASELLAAQDRAKAARKHLWADWDPSQDAADEESEGGDDKDGDTAALGRFPDKQNAVVTHITNDGKLMLQLASNETEALDVMMREFNALHLSPAKQTGLPGPPKAGDLVASKFEDGRWYRARIRANDRVAKKAEVFYIDYGNSEMKAWSDLRPLSQAFSAQKLRAQAKTAVLSLVELSTTEEYLLDAVAYMTELTAGRGLVVSVEHVAADGTLHVRMYDMDKSKSKEDTINAALVEEGLAMVPRKLKAWERKFDDSLKYLRDKETEAKEERRGMYEYGDLTED
ncbi:MAG: hypothetical protein M1818_007375 [Claussenomyces sp. TS43310]|nr:MAG: hypothetical protein M1818_007375 [Claussenomyces sp. TS43310]